MHEYSEEWGAQWGKKGRLMMTDREKETVRKKREEAIASLQSGDVVSFNRKRDAALQPLRDRVEALRRQGIVVDDATAYDDAARFMVEESYAWNQLRRTHLGLSKGRTPSGAYSKPSGGPMEPLSVVLEMIARDEIELVEVDDWGRYDPPQPDVISVTMHLRREAEEALFARSSRRPHQGSTYVVGLARTPSEEPMSDTVRRLSHIPVHPTRIEVETLLARVEEHNRSSDGQIAVSFSPELSTA